MYSHHYSYCNDTVFNNTKHKHTLTALIGLAFLVDPYWDSEYRGVGRGDSKGSDKPLFKQDLF